VKGCNNWGEVLQEMLSHIFFFHQPSFSRSVMSVFSLLIWSNKNCWWLQNASTAGARQLQGFVLLAPNTSQRTIFVLHILSPAVYLVIYLWLFL
jgi:hypothetical protein